MKRLIIALALAGSTLTGCAQLKDAFNSEGAESGATGVEDQRPYPKSSSELGLG
jgi:hypothetical protein